MIWLIAKKDFLLNLLSVRFIIGFVLCLLVIPFTVIVSVENYQKYKGSQTWPYYLSVPGRTDKFACTVVPV